MKLAKNIKIILKNKKQQYGCERYKKLPNIKKSCRV